MRCIQYDIHSIRQQIWNAISASRLYEVVGEREVLWRQSSFINTCRANPGGYQPLQLVYERQSPSPFLFGKVIDQYYLNCPMATAVRARLKAVVTWLERETKRVVHASGKANILSLACGSAYDLVSAFRGAPWGDALMVLGIDADHDAVAQAQRVSSQAGLPQFEFLVGNLRLHQSIPHAPFDMAMSVGFLDYLSDEAATTLSRRAKRILGPKGKFLVSMAIDNPHRPFFEHVLGWQLIYRTNERCHNVLRAAGFSSPKLIANCNNCFSVFECTANDGTS